jgi:hypothetical protein
MGGVSQGDPLLEASGQELLKDLGLCIEEHDTPCRRIAIVKVKQAQ